MQLLLIKQVIGYFRKGTRLHGLDQNAHQEMIGNYCPVYPAASVQLDIANDEYQREKGRSDSLDNKAGKKQVTGYFYKNVKNLNIFVKVRGYMV